MKLVIEYKSFLKEFVEGEVRNKFNSSLEEVKPGLGVIEADPKKVLLNSALIETVNRFIKTCENLKEFKEFDFTELIESSESFRIKSSSHEACVELGRVVQEQTKAEVDLEHPDWIIRVEEVNEGFLAYKVFINDFNLTNRGYSVANSEFITSDVARAIVDYSDWSDEGGVLMDAYCHDGYVIIEALLKVLNIGPGVFRAKELPFDVERPDYGEVESELKCFARSMNDLKFAKRHVELAGLTDYVQYGFHDLRYLDWKMGENKLDYFISALPKMDVQELFFQLEYIMKPDSLVVLYSSQEVEPYLEEYGFELIDEREFGPKQLYKLRRME